MTLSAGGGGRCFLANLFLLSEVRPAPVPPLWWFGTASYPSLLLLISIEKPGGLRSTSVLCGHVASSTTHRFPHALNLENMVLIMCPYIILSVAADVSSGAGNRPKLPWYRKVYTVNPRSGATNGGPCQPMSHGMKMATNKTQGQQSPLDGTHPPGKQGWDSGP